MKCQKVFKIHGNQNAIYLRLKVIDDFKKGMNLTDISKTKGCTIKPAKSGWINTKILFLRIKI